MRLLILGGGNMGGAILHSLEKIKDFSPKDILLIEKDKQKRIHFSKTSGCLSQTKIDENIREYNYILIAIKPQGARDVMSLLARWLLPHTMPSLSTPIRMAASTDVSRNHVKTMIFLHPKMKIYCSTPYLSKIVQKIIRSRLF